MSSPVETYTFIESKKHRAMFTPQTAGVDVLIHPAPNRPNTNFHHFLVPWTNVLACWYEQPVEERPKIEQPVAVAEDATLTGAA